MPELRLVSVNLEYPQVGAYLVYEGSYASCALGPVQVGAHQDIMLDTKTRGLMPLSALSMDDLGRGIIYPLNDYMDGMTKAEPMANIHISRSLAEILEEVMKRRDNTKGIERMAAEGLSQVLLDPGHHDLLLRALSK